MKNLKAALVLAALAAFLVLPLRAEIDAQGFQDACTASFLLERSGISSEVVVAGSEAGCIYETGGVQYLYTTRGSARINPAHLRQLALQRVPRAAVDAFGANGREIRNGCMVFATCAYAGYEQDPHIVWGGIIAARIVAATDGYGDAGPPRNGGLNGHALTAFETDQREVFLQENGEAPRKNEHLTELAQRGDGGWCDSAILAYCDHHIQGFTSFKGEFGHPIESAVSSSPTFASWQTARGRILDFILSGGISTFLGGGGKGGSFSDVGASESRHFSVGYVPDDTVDVPDPSPYGWAVLLATLGFVAWKRFFGRTTLLTRF